MNHPPEIAVTLKDLIRLEHFAVTMDLPKRTVHSVLAGKNISRLRGRGLDFEEVRRYIMGDDIRNIDWRVTARTKVTHSKVFNEEKERPVFTIVDQSSFMFFGSKVYTKSVIAVHAATLAGFRTLKVGDRYGGIIFGDEDFEHITPRRSRVAVLRFLESLVHFNQKLPERKKVKSNREILTQILKRATMTVTHDYVIHIISDFSDVITDEKDNVMKYLISLSMRNDVILTHISDPMDEHLPDTNIILTDGDYQILWNGIHQKFKRDYIDRFKLVNDTLIHQLRKYNISVMTLSTTRPVIRQLKEIFGKKLNN